MEEVLEPAGEVTLQVGEVISGKCLEVPSVVCQLWKLPAEVVDDPVV